MDTFSIYSKLPVVMQNSLCSIKGYLLKKQRYNSSYGNILEFINSTSHWTTNQIKSYKEEKISSIVEHAYKTCPYYKKKYSEVGLTPLDFKSIEDLQKFPILTKEEVRANWKEMLSYAIPKNKLIHAHTSGSTGTPLDFYWTKYSSPYYWALYTRYINRFCNIQDLNLSMSVKPVVPISVKKPPYWRYIKPFNQYRINMQQISNDKIFEIVKFLNRVPIKYYAGYSSIFAGLANKIKESELVISNPPTHIFTGSEKLYDFQKEIIESVFKGVQIHEMYSLSEQVVFASHCIDGSYHEDFEMGHIELANTSSTDNNIFGDILATSFVNFGMPFIRYYTGDTAIFTSQRCNCGAESQVIKDIVGRTEDYVITPEGSKVHTFSYIVKGVKEVKECQIYQYKIDEITIRIVKRENYTSKTENQIIQNVRKYISPSLKVTFEYILEIPRRKSGKFKAVVSEIDKCTNE